MLNVSMAPTTVIGPNPDNGTENTPSFVNKMIGRSSVVQHSFGHLNSSSSIKPEFFDTIKKIAETILDGLNFVIQPIKKVIVLKQLVEVVTVPITIFDIVKTSLSIPKASKEKKIDAGLSICNNIKGVGESGAAFVVALEELSAIPAITAAWATPFAIVMSVLSFASIISNIRTCRKVNRVMQELNLAEESGKIHGKVTLESYRAMLEVIRKRQAEDEDFIPDIFNVDQEKLADALVQKEEKIRCKLFSEDPKDIEEGQKSLEIAVKSLKGRVKQNSISSVIGVTSSIVNIIGTTFLLALPALPIGWAILGLGALTDGARWIHHKVVEYNFIKTMEMKRTTWEWITC